MNIALNSGSKGISPTKDELFGFFDDNPLCNLSYLDADGWPNAATVAFSTTPNFQFIVGTDINSRKSIDMQHDPRVAVTVTDVTQRFTVQLEGEARLVPMDEFDLEFADIHLEKLPMSRPFHHSEGQCYFVITPKHIRFSDVNTLPWTITDYVSDDLTKN